MNQRLYEITREEIKKIVCECVQQILIHDITLLKNDVSERAITHKLAEYIQRRITFLNVDCEYNRNVTKGKDEPKKVFMLQQEIQDLLKSDQKVEDLLEVSTYPDIIVHQRGVNENNLLIIEVKKKNSKINFKHDYSKLEAFTENTELNSYHYEYGVFILFDTGNEKPGKPELKWFVNGSKEERENY